MKNICINLFTFFFIWNLNAQSLITVEGAAGTSFYSSVPDAVEAAEDGFIGELYMLWGITEYNLWLGAIAGVSIILGAVYMLRFFQKSMMGESVEENKSFIPLRIQEDYIFIILMFIILSFGLFPKAWLELSEYAVAQFAHFKI